MLPDSPKCLWIGRYIPYPMDEGAKVYSAKLAESLAGAGMRVRLLGFGETAPAEAAFPHMQWRSVAGQKQNGLRGVMSLLPLAAAIDATAAYKALLSEQLREDWDVIVFDGYGSGWALPQCLAHRDRKAHVPPLLVHVSHNHEGEVWRSLARESDVSALRRIAQWQNYVKVKALEQRLVRSVDLVTTITAEDRRSLCRVLGSEHALTLTPGYGGPVCEQRTITADTARRVIIVGSFRWVMKRENLRRFVQKADPIFKQHGIQLDVVGDVPAELLADLQPNCQVTQFHGFVDDVRAVTATARIAVVPEVIGGGFKLKFLDYIFARVPVATLTEASAGLPEELRRVTISEPNLDALIAAIVDRIDDVALLDHLQQQAFENARTRFRWEDRGHQLRQAIDHLRTGAHASTSHNVTSKTAQAPTL